MNRHTRSLCSPALALSALLAVAAPSMAGSEPAGHQQLVELFAEWRAFERPATRDGAPDYSAAAMAKKHRQLAGFQARLAAIDPSGWPISTQVDHHLVRAEMNGLDFHLRVLKPWARDPAFYASVWTYQSETPAHEGPTHHALVELWSYDFPLSTQDEARLAGELSTIPPLLAQARQNLTGTERSRQLGDDFTLSGFFEDVDALGVIPVSLIRWQLTGKDDEIRAWVGGGG